MALAVVIVETNPRSISPVDENLMTRGKSLFDQIFARRPRGSKKRNSQNMASIRMSGLAELLMKVFWFLQVHELLELSRFAFVKSN